MIYGKTSNRGGIMIRFYIVCHFHTISQFLPVFISSVTNRVNLLFIGSNGPQIMTAKYNGNNLLSGTSSESDSSTFSTWFDVVDLVCSAILVEVELLIVGGGDYVSLSNAFGLSTLSIWASVVLTVSRSYSTLSDVISDSSSLILFFYQENIHFATDITNNINLCCTRFFRCIGFLVPFVSTTW